MARTVVRRSALDKAWDMVLADFPVELHPHLRRYVETRNAANEARGALTLAKAGHGIEWYVIDRALTGI
ncbi:MAG: hypothetical protein WBH47_09940 [Streptosporangiaceae bacterium]